MTGKGDGGTRSVWSQAYGLAPKSSLSQVAHLCDPESPQSITICSTKSLRSPRASKIHREALEESNPPRAPGYKFAHKGPDDRQSPNTSAEDPPSLSEPMLLDTHKCISDRLKTPTKEENRSRWPLSNQAQHSIRKQSSKRRNPNQHTMGSTQAPTKWPGRAGTQERKPPSNPGRN